MSHLSTRPQDETVSTLGTSQRSRNSQYEHIEAEEYYGTYDTESFNQHYPIASTNSRWNHNGFHQQEVRYSGPEASAENDLLGNTGEEYNASGRFVPHNGFYHQDIPEDKDLHKPNYKPSALRWPFLSILLLTLMALVGLVSYSLRVLPDENFGLSPASSHQRSTLQRRTNEATSHAKVYRNASTDTPVVAPTTSQGAHGDINTSITLAPSTRSDAHGVIDTSITATSTSDAYGDIDTTVTVVTTLFSTNSDAHGKVDKTLTQVITSPTLIYVPAITTTMTDSLGVPTKTVTEIPSSVSIPTTTVLTDTLGKPTATAITNILLTPKVSILTNSVGVATATMTEYPVMSSSSAATPRVFYISSSEYIIGFCLPTVLSILIAIPIRTLDYNAKLFQPWHELTRACGSTGSQSLCSPTGGWRATVNSISSLFGGQRVSFFTTALVLCSSLLVPLSAEAVILRLQGNCAGGSAKGCTYELGISAQPAKATIGLLSLMVLAVFFLTILLLRWRSGVSTNPWSICGIASMCQNKDVRTLFTSSQIYNSDDGNAGEKSFEGIVRDRHFRTDWFKTDKGTMDYGIVMLEQDDGIYQTRAHGQEIAFNKGREGQKTITTRHHLPFFMLRYFGRLLFLLILVGLMVMILYYENTGYDTAFERFMDSQSFGVKFLFTSVGVVITLLWSSFFSSIAVMSPYHLLSRRPQSAQNSILLAPPTNAFSGVVSGFRRRHPFLVLVSLTAILSEFLTIFLSNIPFRVTQTWLAARICAWGSIAILAIMVLVVLGSFFVKWPHMPVDPSTIAGAMYYICDSWMLSQMGQTSTLTRKERDIRVKQLRERYEFGRMIGQSGTTRVGVDSVYDRAPI